MKISNLFIAILSCVIITVLIFNNVSLKNEYQKIDLEDVYKNYVSVVSKPYAVLHISGSNGYPIKITKTKTNDIKVLRSRLKHFKNELKNDTMFVKFTGSNIPKSQRYNTTNPYGIFIESNQLTHIISVDTHNRIYDFKDIDLQISLQGDSFAEVNNCNVNMLNVDLSHTSYIDFIANNEADSLNLKMKDKSVASLQKINFENINHSLKDSVTIILSNDTFSSVLKAKK